MKHTEVKKMPDGFAVWVIGTNNWFAILPDRDQAQRLSNMYNDLDANWNSIINAINMIEPTTRARIALVLQTFCIQENLDVYEIMHNKTPKGRINFDNALKESPRANP